MKTFIFRKKQEKPKVAIWKEINENIILSNPIHHHEFGVYVEIIYNGEYVGKINYTTGKIEFVENDVYDIKVKPSEGGLPRRMGMSVFYAKPKEKRENYGR